MDTGRGVLKRAWGLFFFVFVSVSEAHLSDKPIEESSLKNGLQIYIQEDHRAPVVHVAVLYRVGGSYEPLGLTGISHALEHMLFHGTKAHPLSAFSEALDAQGATFNAFTTQDLTLYYANIPSSFLEKTLALEADRMEHIQWDPASFKAELEVVKEERRQRIDSWPLGLLAEYIRATLYTGGDYQHPVIGWMDDIEGLTTAQLRTWYERYYCPNNAVLWVSGDVDTEQVRAWAQKYFGSIKNQGVLHSAPQPIPKAHPALDFKGPRSLTLEVPKGVPQLQMIWRVPALGPALEEQDQWKPYALVLLAEIVSGGKSARLEEHLLRSKKLAVEANMSYSPFSRADALLSLEAIPMAGKEAELEKALWQEIDQLRNHPVPPEELQRALKRIEAQRLYARDSLLATALDVLERIAFGLPLSNYTHWMESLNMVTPAQIQSVAQEYLKKNRVTTAYLMSTGAAS
jgi:zinc protease